MIKFIPLGGAGFIGASSYYLYIDGTGILIDCGIHPRKKGLESLPDFSPLNNLPLDCVIITHAHQDHIGALPFLIKKFPHVKIFSTPQTKEIALLTLNNAVAIIRKEEFDNINFAAYTYEEVEFLVKSIRDYEYGEEFDITGLQSDSNTGLIATFYDAGHILGAASVLIQQGENRIFITGDINLSPQAIMNGAEIPDTRVSTLISESTYGNTDSKKLDNWENEGERLAKFINRIVNSGGSVFIPAFSLGKTQEILAVIANLIEKRKLVDVPVFTGGLGRKISHVYDKNRYLVKRKNPDFELKNFPQQEIALPRLFAEIKNSPSIVIASSGMVLEGTLSFEIVKFWLKQKNYGIGIIGYMDPETPGFKVSQAQIGEKIKLNDLSEEIVNMCEVQRFSFSSHSNRDELLKIPKKLSPKNIILIHGEDGARDWLGHQLLKNYPSLNVFSPNPGSETIIQ